MQHHARQGTALALPAVGAFARRLRNDARPLQMQLEPGVAPAEAVVLHQMLVEMLDRKTLVALAIKRAPPPPPDRPEPACPTPGRAGGPRVQLRLPPHNGASSAGTSARSPRATQPPPPGSAPPIPSGSECSKTSPCAPPEGPPSAASNPSKRGRTYRTGRALPKPDISSATDKKARLSCVKQNS